MLAVPPCRWRKPSQACIPSWDPTPPPTLEHRLSGTVTDPPRKHLPKHPRTAIPSHLHRRDRACTDAGGPTHFSPTPDTHARSISPCTPSSTNSCVTWHHVPAWQTRASLPSTSVCPSTEQMPGLFFFSFLTAAWHLLGRGGRSVSQGDTRLEAFWVCPDVSAFSFVLAWLKFKSTLFEQVHCPLCALGGRGGAQVLAGVACTLSRYWLSCFHPPSACLLFRICLSSLKSLWLRSVPGLGQCSKADAWGARGGRLKGRAEVERSGHVQWRMGPPGHLSLRGVGDLRGSVSSDGVCVCVAIMPAVRGCGLWLSGGPLGTSLACLSGKRQVRQARAAAAWRPGPVPAPHSCCPADT